MNDPQRDFHFDDPEQIRKLGDDDFACFWPEGVQAHDFLFHAGTFMGEEPQYLGDNAIQWMISLEGEEPGQALMIPELPRSILDWAAVLVEEYVTRQFGSLADGILADMCMEPEAYAELWESFGQFSVWESQLSCELAREQCRRAPWTRDARSPDPGRDAVLAYRKELLRRIAAGAVKPLNPKDIMERGLTLLGRRHECGESPVINDMLRRFGSRLRLTASRTVRADKPYAFTLGYSEETTWHSFEVAGERHRIGCESIGLTVARSPALAPDAVGWTPD